jgi:hypothetical protein
LLQTDDGLLLYDISARKVMSEVSVADIKRVYWNSQFTYAAVITKTCKFNTVKYNYIDRGDNGE